MSEFEEYKSLIDLISDRFNLFEFLENLDVGAYLVDETRTIQYWNKKAEEITGYCKEDVVGRSCRDNILVHIDASGMQICPTELCPLVRSMKSKKTSFVPFAVFAKHKTEGKRIPMNVFAFPINIQGLPYSGIEFFQYAANADDLIRAMRIQESFLPRGLPKEVEIFYHPSAFLSGDMIFYEDDYFGIIDVSGHGLPAALISTSLRLVIKDLIKNQVPLDHFGEEIEDKFSSFSITETHFTGVFGKRIEKGISMISFGHPKPLLLKANGDVSELPIQNDTILGFNFPHFTKSEDFIFEEGDSLLIFTDGITEIKTKSGLLDVEGLVQIVKRAKTLQEIYLVASEMSIERHQNDDISMMKVTL
ncbi:MAG TPA: SpoIIE family protein phosphatase [Thermotogota bacterium]|nr:SpoIIE family protein phosphatase [Thermotogota bacterium]HPJ88616.1 SpoIIE family protein phosphatase [Thermotogota bacterium]HPR97173.1 SpoIIE family protein phosphatase [Thermotogota bacterium]